MRILTYQRMTVADLGDGCTPDDLARFQLACREQQKRCPWLKDWQVTARMLNGGDRQWEWRVQKALDLSARLL